MVRDTRRSFVRNAATLVAGSAALGAAGASGVAASDREYEAAVETAIHDRVNAVRAEHGLDPLSYREDLAAAAASHSQDMAERSYLSHTSPEGETMTDRYERFDVDCWGRAENVLYNYASDESPTAAARRSVDQWMGSDGHRRNVLSTSWTAEGIGAAVADDGRLYVTQNFGSNCR
ncbi:CAP domain-containing protein [Natronococcus occultus]|uniref:Uncharacterized protein with SCP/PR1 domains n=1 Tax=Natronococcus occultus SP4 TaxID=694430 RepID=L0JV37_9EURY|nr:CAP domain-containing protein [Natronococcus occultus]AGB36636.1 uncharacterized protein with SCP/PR1 domains [Natronococcus occultus SP4]